MKNLVPAAVIPAIQSKVDEGNAQARAAQLHASLVRLLGSRGPCYSSQQLSLLMEQLLEAQAASLSAAVASSSDGAGDVSSDGAGEGGSGGEGSAGGGEGGSASTAPLCYPAPQPFAVTLDQGQLPKGVFYNRSDVSDGTILFACVRACVAIADSIARGDVVDAPDSHVGTQLVVVPGPGLPIAPVVAGRTSGVVVASASDASTATGTSPGAGSGVVDCESSDSTTITSTSPSWGGVVYDAPLRRTHNWFEVRVVDTGLLPGRGAAVCLGLSYSADPIAAPGLAEDTVGLDLSTNSLLLNAALVRTFNRGTTGPLDVVPGDVLFCALARRADGGADVTFGVNRTVVAFYSLPPECSLCAGGGCFPVVSVFGSARVSLLPILPSFSVELARYVNTEQVVRDAVECPTPLDGLGLATPVPPPRAVPAPAAPAPAADPHVDSAPEVDAAVV